MLGALLSLGTQQTLVKLNDSKSRGALAGEGGEGFAGKWSSPCEFACFSVSGWDRGGGEGENWPASSAQSCFFHRLLSTTPPDLSGAGRVGLARGGGAEAAVRGQAGMLPTPPPPASNGLASVNGEEAKHQRG